MKKLIFSLLLGLLSLEVLHAGYIVPDIARNKKELNDTALAQIWQKRKFADAYVNMYSGDYEVTDLTSTPTTTTTSDYSDTEFGATGMFYAPMFSTQLQAASKTIERTSPAPTSTVVQTKFTDVEALIGIPVNKDFGAAFSLNYLASSQSTSSLSNTTDNNSLIGFIGGVYRLENSIYLGAGYKYKSATEEVAGHTTATSNYSLDLTTGGFLLAAGYSSPYTKETKQGYLLELAIEKLGGKKIIENGHSYEELDQMNVVLHGSYKLPMFYLDAKAFYSVLKNDGETTETTINGLMADLEFRINSLWYVTPQFVYSISSLEPTTGTSLTETTDFNYGAAVGFRQKQFDLTLAILMKSATVEASTNGNVQTEAKTSGLHFGLDAAFFF